MFPRLSPRHFDYVMLMDAILISLACILILLAYREVNQAPMRHAHGMANAVMAVADDFANDDPFAGGSLDENGSAQLAVRYRESLERIRSVEGGAEFVLYSDHPLLSGVTSKADPEREAALEKFRAGDFEKVEEVARTDRGNFFRTFAPLRAFRDCARCAVAGMPEYRKGDVIGLREVIIPIGDEYAQAINKLLYACGMLASALMVFIGLIMPVYRRSRQESAKNSDRADSFEQQAVTDPLTGLHNRRYFEGALKELLEEHSMKKAPLGLLLLDLDHFKNVNDTYGHDWGDIVLKEVAFRLKAITRQNDVVARIGGEEFAIIAPYASSSQLVGIAERYRQYVESLRVDIENVTLRPTVSIGLASNGGQLDTVDEMFKAADKKLYEAKRRGRNRVAA